MNDNFTKRCNACQVVKPLSEFHEFEQKGQRYHKRSCNSCRLAQQKRYRENSEYRIAYVKKYYEENKQEVLAKSKERQRLNRERDYLRIMWRSAKTRAQRKGVPFTIQISDIQIPETCPILGIPLKMAEGRASDNSPSLDKVIPSKGYTPDNIIVMSYRANVIKNAGNAEEHRKIADWLDGRLNLDKLTK